MQFTVHNSLTKTKQTFAPLQANKIRMYVCGITVYDYCHIGHARVMVGFDVITRYLRFRGWDVEYVRNITDVDDKILARAKQNGETIEALTERFIDAMHEDERVLGVLPPDQEPRATAHMSDIIEFVQVLMEKQYAYLGSNGDIYYRVSKFAEYGKLSGRDPEQLLAGARVEIASAKEDPRDFVLWKSVPAEEQGWDSPWGWGRPGWHIECSAMSKCCLGDTFDIHGGGPDLPFPHHENEIAQSEAANNCTMANYWMHCGAVRVDGRKMSKSEGNFFTIREVLKKYHPEVVRYLLISSQYRSAINYSEDNLIEAKAGLERFYYALRDLDALDDNHQAKGITSCDDAILQQHETYRVFTAAMDNDFNVPAALNAMYELVSKINSAINRGDIISAQADGAVLKRLGSVLGVLQLDANEFLQAGGEDELSADKIEQLLAERVSAKAEKNYQRSDEIRQYLIDQGIQLEDTKDGTLWRRS